MRDLKISWNQGELELKTTVVMRMLWYACTKLPNRRSRLLMQCTRIKVQ